MNWIMITGLVVAGIVLVIAMAIAAGLFVYFDLLSYTAKGSKLLDPAGTPAGRALVVYDPGVSGAAKDAAVTMAGDLQSKGYSVNLAGVRSTAAADTSGYDVIVAGGPMYGGKVAGSVEAYLKALKPEKYVALGVFATTGAGQFNNDDIASFGKQVAELPCSGMLNRTTPTKTIRTGDAGNVDCSEFVSAVL
jgi:hypothetical protein